VLHAQAAGPKAAEFVPVTMWITAAVFALASLAGRSRAARRSARVRAPRRAARVRGALARLKRTWTEASRFAGLHAAAGLQHELPGGDRRGDRPGRHLCRAGDRALPRPTR
jgi:hypothetical protein